MRLSICAAAIASLSICQQCLARPSFKEGPSGSKLQVDGHQNKTENKTEKKPEHPPTEHKKPVHEPTTKYFWEPGYVGTNQCHRLGALLTLMCYRGDQELSHYDRRYFHGVASDEERTDTQSHMVRAYLTFFRENKLDTWIAHGTLLGWWWNGKVQPLRHTIPQHDTDTS
jgi:hypothetical protein